MRKRVRAAVAAVVVVGLLSACADHTPTTAGGASPSSAAPDTVAPTHPITSARPAAAPTSAPSHSPTAHQIEAASHTVIAKIISTQPQGGVSVAALNLTTGAKYSAGAKSGMWTASSYKLLVLVAMLMRSGTVPSDDVPAATRAIENSDNKEGYDLFLDAGGSSGLQSVLAKLGMSHTRIGVNDPTFTTTSASDYLHLLQAIATRGPLSKSSRAFVVGLMRNVEADQRWGVGVVADKGTTFANKNGWLSIDNSNAPGETDNGLWAVSSVGVVTVAHQQVLMSVFTQHQSDFDTGVTLVQKLARALVRTVVPAAG